MRFIVLTAVAAIAALSFDVQASGGVYAAAPAPTAAVCERRCADDGLCMAWSLTADQSCELRATVPASTPAGAWGLSVRAPGVLRERLTAGSVPAAATPSEPIGLRSTLPPEAHAEAQPAEDDISLMLLGGLEGEHVAAGSEAESGTN